ncbi:hypothetical protein TKK_0018936 [Trichogramma kaykai]
MLMEGKKQLAYAKIFQIVSDRRREFGIQLRQPPRIMSDFELAIINAAAEFGGNVRLCLFHLCQSVYRFLCEVGLQSAYKDSNNDSAHKVYLSPWMKLNNFLIFSRNKKNCLKSLVSKFYRVSRKRTSAGRNLEAERRQ